jgi:glycosyltransferase involved in cell wall biosynthesis
MKNEERPITILQLCEHFGNEQISFHGVSRSFELWIPAFDKKRFRVLLCSRQGAVKAAEDRFRAAGIRPLYLGYGKTDPRNLFKLMKLIRQENVDIVHAHGYGACMWGRLAGMLLGRPVIVHERCNYHTVPWFQRPIEWVLGPGTRYAFAVSESTRKFTVEKRYIPESVVKVLYSGIPLNGVRKADPAWIASFRQEQGVGPNDRVLGVVGRIESHKGHLDAFLALERVLKEMPNVHLWIVGDGRYEEVLRRWVADNKMENRIRFLGYRADVLNVIQCFDIQLFPSHQEGTPNTLYEAMAIGNAPVASTADGQGEILEDGETALLFAPGDSEKMADQILRVLKDDFLRRTLQRNVQVRIKDFDMTRTIATLEATYERIMAERQETVRR